VKDRFLVSEFNKMRVLKIWYYNNGADAFDAEQEILREHAEQLYTGWPVLTSGNTELFISDVLGLDDR
jgi:hypothetical protein